MGNKDSKSLFNPVVVARIKALEAASRGAIRGPQGGYFRALISATPQNPTLRVVAMRRQNHETVIGVGMGRPGETDLKTVDFSIKGVLTEANAEATGHDIAELLGDPGAAAHCANKLKELSRAPEGDHRIFYLGEFERLEITDGR